MSKSTQSLVRTLIVLVTVLVLVPSGPALAQGFGSTEGGNDPDVFDPDGSNENEGEVTLTIIPNSSRFDSGQPATFRVVTKPAGFENQVKWSATNSGGSANPPSGAGSSFSTRFLVDEQPCNQFQITAVLTLQGAVAKAVWTQNNDEQCPGLLIPPGEDCWETDECKTIASFCASPLPAGFFGTGSLEWRDEVPLEGSDGIAIDTTITRLDSVAFAGLGTRTTRIQMNSLDLQSCNPIDVRYQNGPTEQWGVEVKQSDFAQPVGTMSIHRTFATGGSFDSNFGVHVKYVFTSLDDPTRQVSLDTGDPANNLQPLLFAPVGTAPWVSQLESHIKIPVCSANFHPGVRGGGGAGVRQCCKPIGHAGPGHLHVTGQKCAPCPDGGCKNTSNLTCRMSLRTQCVGPNEVFLGEGTDCRDSDGDGLLDRVEKDDCCKAGQIPQDACNALSSPSNADTDGDGINDGQEILLGRDPCTPGS